MKGKTLGILVAVLTAALLLTGCVPNLTGSASDKKAINELINRYEQGMRGNSADALADLANLPFVGSLGLELMDRANVRWEYNQLFQIAEVLDYRVLEREINLGKDEAVAELTAYVKDRSRFGGPEDVYEEYRRLELRKAEGKWGIYKDEQIGIVD
ncbi:MAG TPA: hypothetical protein PLM25_06510 [Limnochordia bacterium]|nr:hypothetical protein [Limnochordia bacterium]